MPDLGWTGAESSQAPRSRGRRRERDLSWTGGQAAEASPSEGGGTLLGMTPVTQAGMSLGRRVIDVLSRPGRAVLGAAEETFSPAATGGPMAAEKRAFRELFSGLPFTDIQGDKRDLSAILERAGVGELGRLSDILPIYNDTGEGAAFERGGWADFTGRGAVGLAGDILSDPLTWITAGGATARRFLTNSGEKFLSKKGMAALAEEVKNLDPAWKFAQQADDHVLRETARRQIDDVLRKNMEARIATDPKLLDKTGIKFFGQEVISDRALKGLSSTAQKAALSFPGGDKAARVANGINQTFRRMFDPYAELAGLPPDVVAGMKRLATENRSSAAIDATRLFARWSSVEAKERALARRYGGGEAGLQALGKKFADWRQGTGVPTLSQEELNLFSETAKLYDEWGERALRTGLITPEQYAIYQGKYLHQSYKNPEVLSETLKTYGRPGSYPLASEGIQQERQFDTYAEAVEKSRELRRRGLEARERGVNMPVYGELIPEYGISRGLGDYIQQLTRKTWQKKYVEEARDKFGLQLDQFMEPGRVFDVTATANIPKADRVAIETLLNGNKTINDLAEQFGNKIDGWDVVAKEARRLLPTLSPDGQRELARELTAMTRTPGQVMKVAEAVGDHLMPTLRAKQPGQVSEFYSKYGMDGTLVPVGGGGIWGDKEYLIPNAVRTLVEDAPRDFLMDAANRKGLQGLLKGYDKYGNLFKGITYPGYPSGAFRDIYNNVIEGFLAIGVGAFARPFEAMKILKGGDDVIRIGGRELKAREWKRLGQDLGVTDPSATAFAQLTGEGVKRSGVLAKARAARGSVDNWTRTQLWDNSMRMGMTPEDAAKVVQDFDFDYRELSAFDRDVMRRAIPFWVFPRKAIERYARSSVTTPGRVVNIAKPFRGRDDENNSMTTWEGEGYKVRLDRDGDTLTMLNGVDLPIRSLDVLFRGTWRKTGEGLIGMANPALKVPYEYFSGRDPFRGKEFGRRDAQSLGPLLEKSPGWVKAFVGFQPERDQAGRPKYTYREDRVTMLSEALLISRIVSTSDRAYREQLRDPNMLARVLDFFTGLRYKTLNLTEEERRQMESRRREAQEEAVKQGEMKRHEILYETKEQQRRRILQGAAQ